MSVELSYEDLMKISIALENFIFSSEDVLRFHKADNDIPRINFYIQRIAEYKELLDKIENEKTKYCIPNPE